MVRREAQTECPRHDQSQTCCNTQFLSVLAETPRTGFPFIPSWVTGFWQWWVFFVFFFRQLLSGQQQPRADTRPWEFLAYCRAVVMAGLRLQGFKPFAMVWGRGGSKTSSQAAHLGKSLAWLWEGLWDASPQIQSPPCPVHGALSNLNRLSHSLSSSINVCLDSSHGPHTQPVDQVVCGLSLHAGQRHWLNYKSFTDC